MSKDQYESPLGQRYASREMKHIFSDDVKFSTWRKLWIALAEAERDLGIDIKQEQIDEMQAHIYDIDYEKAAEFIALHAFLLGVRTGRGLSDSLRA